MALPQRDILTCAEHLDQLEQEFHSKMEALKETVQAKTAVPTAQVYVSVCRLKQCWQTFNDLCVIHEEHSSDLDILAIEILQPSSNDIDVLQISATFCMCLDAHTHCTLLTFTWSLSFYQRMQQHSLSRDGKGIFEFTILMYQQDNCKNQATNPKPSMQRE